MKSAVSIVTSDRDEHQAVLSSVVQAASNTVLRPNPTQHVTPRCCRPVSYPQRPAAVPDCELVVQRSNIESLLCPSKNGRIKRWITTL